MNANDKVVDEICKYAEEKEIHSLLKEYMRRLVVEQPREPLKFLISSIAEKPYVPKPKADAGPDAPAAPSF
jgi:hypothetical protein